VVARCVHSRCFNSPRPPAYPPPPQFPRWRRIDDSSSPTPFDLIHMRDVIQHMPMNVAMRTIQHVVASGAKYLVTTTWQGEQYVNKDDRKSDAFYQNNLAAEPFNFPPPLFCKKSHADNSEQDDTCLYDIAQVSLAASKYAVEG
jgi:hypothetical protein